MDPAREPDALVVTGPTASGKTRLALEVAEAVGGEIVSMDSRQVYRGMDVGTAKATAAQRARVPHHGLDLVDPDQAYSAGRFAREARSWIDGISGRGRVPLLVGGTGFFLRALTRPVFREPDLDPERRTGLRDHLSTYPRPTLERWVRALDPERAEVAAEGGPQRMIRTLEVTLLTGRPLSWWHRAAPADGPALEPLIVVLGRPRPELDRRIDRRVTRMLEAGLVEEVRGLLEAGYGAEDPGLSGVGYREIVAYLEGEWSLEEAADAIRRSTRRYARRQLTWFRNQLPADGVHRLDATRPTPELVAAVVDRWKRRVGEETR